MTIGPRPSVTTPKANPPPKPRQKRTKNGKTRKEPAKTYVQRCMDDPKMIADFPDGNQRYAVAMTYAEKFYGPRIYSNPPIAKDAEGGDIMLESEEAADMAALLKAQAEAAFIERFGKDMSEMKRSPPPPSSPSRAIPPMPPMPPMPPKTMPPPRCHRPPHHRCHRYRRCARTYPAL